MAQNVASYQTRMYQILFGLGLVFLALVLVKTIMGGNTTNLGMAVGLIAAVCAVLALDKYYWVLFPLLTAGGVLAIPGLPFNGAELACIAVIGVYFVRLAAHRAGGFRVNSDLLVSYPLFVWIFFIWALNPTGFAIFGSESIGARFYLRIIMGFLTLHVFSTLALGERECKIFFWALLAGLLISFVNSMVFGAVVEQELAETGETAGARYYLIAFAPLYHLLFCRFSLGRILTSPWLLFLVSASALATVISGKRQLFARLVILPVVRAIVTRQYRMMTAVCCFIGILFLTFAVAGDGALWSIPDSAKRSLAVVFPSLRESGRFEGTSDTFREEVHKSAAELIKRHPWVGRRGFAMSRENASWLYTTRLGEVNFALHVASGNWHGYWHAFAADFGIPGAVMAGIVLFYITFRGLSLCRKIPMNPPYRFTVAFYYANLILGACLFSITSGHSSTSLLALWPNFGILLAVQNGLTRRTLEKD